MKVGPRKSHEVEEEKHVLRIFARQKTSWQHQISIVISKFLQAFRAVLTVPAAKFFARKQKDLRCPYHSFFVS